MDRNLDGVYFRICRDGKWQAVCFSDMTEAEMEQVLYDVNNNDLKNLCIKLAERLREVGDGFDLSRERKDKVERKTLRNKCYECEYRRNASGNAHSLCTNRRADVKGNEHAEKNGWFAWPHNVDPIWLKECDGFKLKGGGNIENHK